MRRNIRNPGMMMADAGTSRCRIEEKDTSHLPVGTLAVMANAAKR